MNAPDILVCKASAVVASVLLVTLVSCMPYPPVAPPPPVGFIGGGPAGPPPADGPAPDSSDPAPAPPPQPDASEYPKGYKTQNPHHIISPYKPHNLIDISKNPKTGQPFVSGNLVKDPSNNQIFRIP